MNKIEINDLRSAIEYLKNVKGQLVKSDVEVDPRWGISRSLQIYWSWWNREKTYKNRAGNDI